METSSGGTRQATTPRHANDADSEHQDPAAELYRSHNQAVRKHFRTSRKEHGALRDLHARRKKEGEGIGWIVELLHIAAACSPNTDTTNISFEVSAANTICTFPAGPDFARTILDRLGQLSSTSGYVSNEHVTLPLLLGATDQPKFWSDETSLHFVGAASQANDFHVAVDLGDMTFVRSIENPLPVSGEARISLRTANPAEHLEQLRRFPLEFLALLPGEISVVLNDVMNGTRVSLAKKLVEGHSYIELAPGLSQRAKAHASAEIAWSFLDGRTGPGALCAYAPTNASIPVPGLLKAEWNIGPDGTIFESEHNDDLLEQSAQLVLSNEPELAVRVADLELSEPTWVEERFVHHLKANSIEELAARESTIEREVEPMPTRAAAKPLTIYPSEQTVGDEVDIILKLIPEKALRKNLPNGLLDEVAKNHRITKRQVAELALAVHGVEILRNHKKSIRGEDVPQQWAGKSKAVGWVTEQGLTADFAGFKNRKRDALTAVDGPPNLPVLHDFQRDAVEKIRALIRDGDQRALLSLPTGAGKTRTATHALIEAIREQDLRGPLLWVAESAELCEQAVDAWSANWRQIGPNETLQICRLWGSNDVFDLHSPFQLVIATEAKLRSCRKKPEYQWLFDKVTCLVVDEAHRATSPTFTALLDDLGMDHRTDRIPVIGLSATPYRNTDEEATNRLVNRFGKTRLDNLGDDPYEMLQERRILARVEHKTIEGIEIELLDSERALLEDTGFFPTTVLQRIGENTERNQQILTDLKSLPEDFSVLLFASSVDHAQLLAGLLSIEGIGARAITGSTNKGARAHYIDQFRRGEIRVLTNFGVLKEGFDAPAVKAVYIARPIYSWNLYQQIVGRGLRGPLNGGKETCLIVTVADNLEKYGLNLAYQDLEYMWKK